MQTYSKLELNGYLTKLTEGWDEEAAKIVVLAFHKLPIAPKRIYTRRESKNNASMTGHTNEAGNFTIKDKEVKTTTTGEPEEAVARIGYYKVKQSSVNNGESYVITWEHFWASDITTASFDKPPKSMFGVEYTKEDLNPIALLRWDYVINENPGVPSLRYCLYYLRHLLAGLLKGETVHVTKSKDFIAYPAVIYGKSKIKI